MAKQIIARNSSSRTHRRVHALDLLFVASILVSLAVLLATCGPTAGSDTSSQSADAPAEEHDAQGNEEAEPEATTNTEATKPSPEEIAQHRAEAQRRHRELPCWVTLSGHSYHQSKTCPELDGSMALIEMTVGEAIDAGYDPCWYCSY